MKTTQLVSKIYQSTAYSRELWKKGQVNSIRKQIEQNQYQSNQKDFFNYLRRIDVVKRKHRGQKRVSPFSNKQLKKIYDLKKEYRAWKEIKDDPKKLYPPRKVTLTSKSVSKPKVILRKHSERSL